MKRKSKVLLSLVFAPLSIFAQNGEIGGGSNGEIIFWLFVLGFLVSILPEREKRFEQKAMKVLKVSIIAVLIPLVSFAQSKDIIEGRRLPDFETAIDWDIRKIVDGAKTATCYLPLLDACHFGNYKIQWYFYDSNILYRYGNEFEFFCWFKVSTNNYELDDETKERFSKSYHAHGNGRWYCRISGVDCGYVYSYEVKDKAFAWRLDKVPCN